MAGSGILTQVVGIVSNSVTGCATVPALAVNSVAEEVFLAWVIRSGFLQKFSV